MLYNRFTDEIQKNNFIHEGDKVLATVSGGADSVCLFDLLLRYREKINFNLICAHVNHMIRKEAEEDTLFVKSLCKKHDIPFFLHRENVVQYAKDNKISVELAGREVRYKFFNTIDCDVIMTAHNKNDVAETMLLHLIRGCGIEGLTGISAINNNKIVRPLLSFSKKEILQYLLEHKLSWKEDVTNSDIKYTRNKIRHEIIPRLEEINPSFLDAASRTANILKEENEYINTSFLKDEGIRKENGNIFFSISCIQKYPLAIQRRIIHEFVESFYEVDTILSLFFARNGTRYSLSNNKIAIKEYNEILLCEDIPPKFQKEIELPENGVVEFGSYKITVGKGQWKFPKRRYFVRTRQNGDYFYPEGLNGKKKIKDFFIDLKIPKRMRDEIPLLVCNNEIAAVGNLRISKNFIAKDEPYIYINIEQMNRV